MGGEFMTRLIAIGIVLMGFPVIAQARTNPDFPVSGATVSYETQLSNTYQRDTIPQDPSGATRPRRYQARSARH